MEYNCVFGIVISRCFTYVDCKSASEVDPAKHRALVLLYELKSCNLSTTASMQLASSDFKVLQYTEGTATRPIMAHAWLAYRAPYKD